MQYIAMFRYYHYIILGVGAALFTTGIVMLAVPINTIAGGVFLFMGAFSLFACIDANLTPRTWTVNTLQRYPDGATAPTVAVPAQPPSV